MELLLHTAAGRTIATRIADPALSVHVPHLADIEVTQALRRYANDGDLDPADAANALEDLLWIWSATPTSRCSIGCGGFGRT